LVPGRGVEAQSGRWGCPAKRDAMRRVHIGKNLDGRSIPARFEKRDGMAITKKRIPEGKTEQKAEKKEGRLGVREKKKPHGALELWKDNALVERGKGKKGEKGQAPREKRS